MLNDLLCFVCISGTYKEKDCPTTSTPTECKPCEKGSFMATTNNMSPCLSCKTCNSAHKKKTWRECTAQKDTICECVSGYVCSDSDCNHCRIAKLCPAGQGVTAKAFLTNDTVCSPCGAGSFSNVTDHVSACKPHTRCEDIGRQRQTPGTTTTDAVCGEFITKECSWMLPAGLWIGLVLTSVLVFALALFYWKRKKRRFNREVNLSRLRFPWT
ncbi:hypothetical protein WMY93_026518 [Mugilogobius chulae]|uniref:TNFR-Cys domain-containing protein n=1 Tax=Mugilogobius chulae TaxID=88201 RepID=A0AAW0N4I0_9GOBI